MRDFLNDFSQANRTAKIFNNSRKLKFKNGGLHPGENYSYSMGFSTLQAQLQFQNNVEKIVILLRRLNW
jgi:hypothetical protein